MLHVVWKLWTFLFGDNGVLEGYDYNLKEINNNENDISLEELYNLSLKFKNEDYNVIEVIVEWRK